MEKPSQPPQKRTVVVVEDMHSTREFVSILLEAEDFEVFPAKDGPQALRLVREKMPLAALVDIRLPKTDGFEVCRQIKADPGLRHIKVVFFSALSSHENKKAAFAMGADGFLDKPVEPGKLADTLRKLLPSE